jgi:hypothetical protein
MTIRDQVAELMVLVHRIPRALAEQHVAKYDDAELDRRIAMYARVQHEAGMELSAVACGAQPCSRPEQAGDFLEVKQPASRALSAGR